MSTPETSRQTMADEIARPYRVESAGGTGGDAPAHLHLDPASAGTVRDVYRKCRADDCAIRPLYRRPPYQLDDADDETDAAQSLADRHEAMRPQLVPEAEWAELLRRWTTYEDTPETRAVNKVIVAEKRAGDAELRAAANHVAYATWYCPDHGPDTVVTHDALHGLRFRLCSVCGAHPEDRGPRVSNEPAYTGWSCWEHGVTAVVTLKTADQHAVGDGRVYAACRMCDQYEGRTRQRSSPFTSMDPIASNLTATEPAELEVEGCKPVAPKPRAFKGSLGESCLLWLGILAVPVLASLLGWWPAIFGVIDAVFSAGYELLRIFPFWDWKNQL